MQLIDERNQLSRRVLDLIEDSLEPLLELAAVLGARHHGTQVQRDDGLAPQALWHVTGHDALRQTFHDGSLADTGLPDQHRVVLGATAQNLDHTPDFGIAPDHRVKLALTGPGSQVGGVLLQRLERRLGFGAGDPAATAHLDEGIAQRLRRGTVIDEELGDIGVSGRQANQQVLGRHIVVVEFGGQMLRGRHGGNRVTRELRIGAGITDLRKPIGDSLRFVAYGHRINAHGLQKRRGDAIGLAEQCHQ